MIQMRILHTSDWHLGKTLENISRLEEQQDFIDTLCHLAEEEKVDLVLVAGDIFDTYNPSAAAEELFYGAMERLNAGGKRAVVVIAGNHDNPERLCAASALAYKDGIILLGYPASNAGDYTVEDEGIRITDSGPGWLELQLPGCSCPAVILTMPYPSESRLEQVLSEEAKEGTLSKAYSDRIAGIFQNLSKKFREDTVNLVVAHLFLAGGKESESERTIQVGTAMTVNPSALPANAHFAALGHLHRPQQMKAAPCPAYYSGSPLAYSFSEADYTKALYVIDAQPGVPADVKTVYLNCGKPLRKWSAKEGIGQALQWCEEGRDKNAWVDLEIYTDRILTAEEQKHMRELHPGIINIRPVLRTEAGESLQPESREGRKIDELFREYYRYRLGTDIHDELMAAFLEVLNDREKTEDISADGNADSTLIDAGMAVDTLGMQEAAAGMDDGGDGHEA
jgi:exonuclease SbcD